MSSPGTPLTPGRPSSPPTATLPLHARPLTGAARKVRPGAGRPAVLDASRTALIPLRPLTIGEILDGGFLIVRRNVRLMLGLPLVIAGGAGAYVLAGVGLWFLLGNTTIPTARIVVVVLMGLLGLLLLQQCLVWMTAILSRISLQTVLGDGFAPSVSKVTLRSSLPLFWPMLGLSLLQYVVLSLVQTGLSILSYAVTIGSLLAGNGDGTGPVIASVVIGLVTYLALMIVYGYLSLTVPALSTESRHAPGWIGKPAKATTVISSFERAFRLVGKANVIRVGLVVGGTFAISVGLVVLAAFGTLVILALFAGSINLDLQRLLSNGWTIFGVVTFAVLVATSAVLAYASAVQTLLYLDLRMRREGLDLAMRFDCVPVPQPVAPPVLWVPAPGPWPGGPR